MRLAPPAGQQPEHLLLPLLCFSACPPHLTSAPPGISGFSGGERRRAAEEKVSLHPEEAGGAQRQVPEALHPKTERKLLTAAPCGGAAPLEASTPLLSRPPSPAQTLQLKLRISEKLKDLIYFDCK